MFIKQYILIYHFIQVQRKDVYDGCEGGKLCLLVDYERALIRGH